MRWINEPLYEGILTGKHKIRFRNEEKHEFISLPKKEFDSLKIKNFAFLHTHLPLLRGKNIIIGNIENADAILTAHFDASSVPPYNFS